MKSNFKIDAEKAQKLKKDIYEGMRQEDAAIKYNLTQPHVSRITNGKIWADIPWPDGQTGPIDWRHHRAIQQGRNDQTGVKKPLQITPDVMNMESDAPVVVENPQAAMPVVEDYADAAEHEMEEEFLHDMMSVSDETRQTAEERPRLKIEEMQALDWDDIRLVDPHNPLVIFGENDIIARAAIQKTFSYFEPEKWDSQAAEKLFKDVCKAMGHEIKNEFYLGEDRRRAHHPVASEKFREAKKQAEIARSRRKTQAEINYEIRQKGNEK